MAAPTITAGSITTFGSATPANFTIPISAAQVGRILVLGNLSKDDSSVVSLVNSLAFDAAGANATIANGKINEQGTTQIALEGIRSSQCGVYFIKNADLPATAGPYIFEPSFNAAVDKYLWVCFELLGCPSQGYDNIVQNISITDVAAAAKFSASITPVDNDCLIVDIWATSHSANTIFTSTETAVAQVSVANAGGVVSQFTQITAAAKAMEQESSLLHQRRAWTLLSFSGVDQNININANTQALTITTNKATVDKARNIDANTAAITVVTNQAIVNKAKNVNVNLTALNITTQKATINTAKSILANNQSLIITPYSATITLNTNINAGFKVLTITTNKATITVSGNTNINAGFQLLTITTNNAQINTGININANLATLKIMALPASVILSTITKANERTFVISGENRTKVVH